MPLERCDTPSGGAELPASHSKTTHLPYHIGAHLVDPPFIPSSGYLVLPLCRQYFDPQMGLGHVGLSSSHSSFLDGKSQWLYGSFRRQSSACAAGRGCAPRVQCQAVGAVVLRWLRPRNHHRWRGSLHGPSTLVSFINGCHWTQAKVADLTLALHNWPEYLSWLHPRNHHRRCGSGLLRGPNVWAP